MLTKLSLFVQVIQFKTCAADFHIETSSISIVSTTPCVLPAYPKAIERPLFCGGGGEAADGFDQAV